MEGCGFCRKAKELLKNQIESGEIVLKDADESGGKYQGFPAFESLKNGKSHLGLPKSYNELLEKLEVVENYHSVYTHKSVGVGIL